jgi:hypothetical protein
MSLPQIDPNNIARLIAAVQTVLTRRDLPIAKAGQ